MFSFISRAGAVCAAAVASLLLGGCDARRISELEEDVSTEQDVRARFGEPEKIWNEANGAHTLEYNRQPAGRQNYMITIGPDGKMTALRQVLAPHNFEQVHPGMDELEIRKLLGKPRKMTPYALKAQTVWDWGYIDPPNTEMEFSVTFDALGRVLTSGSTLEVRNGP